MPSRTHTFHLAPFHLPPSMVHAKGPELSASDHEIVHDRLCWLADDLLCKSKDELLALAECNPALVNEWLQEFRQRKLCADQEARLWATSASRLARALSKTLTDAAEQNFGSTAANGVTDQS